ncbi:MAG: hypothetical protein K9G36_03250 [Crocinitomicaceae bacterium]|nr:hypothetical protein [Crocinitomicaceae bacterium]MCF8443438.1 hypothetical protein [Crocinitomicaceae bacterium]
MKALTLTFLFIAACLSPMNSISAQRSVPVAQAAFTVVKVSKNPVTNAITVMWNDNRFDELEIVMESGELFMPSFPVFDAQQISLNELNDGYYYIKFMGQGQLLETKVIHIQNNMVIAKN